MTPFSLVGAYQLFGVTFQLPCRWRQYFPPKLSKLSTNPRAVTTTVYKNIKTETLLMYVNFYYIINLLYFRAPSDCFVPSTWQNQFPIPYKATAEIIVVLKLSIPRILAVNLFVLFQLNAHNTLNTRTYVYRGTAVAQWLRRCATNRKVAGSIAECVIGIFHWHNHSDRTMALWSTQPATEISTKSIFWG